jgi:hypothetical protein
LPVALGQKKMQNEPNLKIAQTFDNQRQMRKFDNLSSKNEPILRRWVLASSKKGRNCETNPISFKTYYPPNTNNENISLFTKSKPYDPKRQHGPPSAARLKAAQG